MTQIGNVYGQALYSLAREEGLDTKVLSQLKILSDCFAREGDFVRLLASRNIPKEERCHIVDESFRPILHPYVLNFLKLLTEKDYIRHFSACVDTYRENYNEDHNILPVQAVTAVALTQEQSEKLSAKLRQITGKSVELTNRVEPGCIGGMRLDYDGKRVDDTVSHRLENIRSLLKNTVL